MRCARWRLLQGELLQGAATLERLLGAEVRHLPDELQQLGPPLRHVGLQLVVVRLQNVLHQLELGRQVADPRLQVIILLLQGRQPLLSLLLLGLRLGPGLPDGLVVLPPSLLIFGITLVHLSVCSGHSCVGVT